MEELSPDDLQQIEENLYSQIHHAFEEDTFDQTKNTSNPEQSVENAKFLSKRYWANKSFDETPQKSKSAYNDQRNRFNNNNNNMKRTQAQKQQPCEVNPFSGNKQNKQHHKSNNNNRKVRNPFARPQEANNKNNKMPQRQTKNSNRNGGPLAEKLEKIQRLNQFHNKKDKANNARAKSLNNPKVVATISLDLDSDNVDDDDDVVIVPIPPAPIVSIDDSDEEMPVVASKQHQSPPVPLPENASRCASPASIMSHDDFIGQCDRQRLLMVDNNGDSFLEAPTSLTTLSQENISNRRNSNDDIECIGTFIKPKTSMMKPKEKDYHVRDSDFRAIDVYESESDIVSDGVYSKGSNKPQVPNTSINSPENDSDEDLADISQNPSKTKRLRKRRASTSIRSSESNGHAETSDSDCENDGVVETGVPFIYRGPALDNQKTKKKRKRNMSDTEFVATLNSLAQGNDNINTYDSESESNDKVENAPTAREIAEQVLNINQSLQQANDAGDDVIEVPSTSNAKRLINHNEAVPADIVDDIEKIMEKVNEINAKKAEAELTDDDENMFNITTESHILAASDVSTRNIDDLESTMHEAEDDNKIKYFISYSPGNSNCLSDGCGWNEEMRRFYNYSWGGEHFREDKVLGSMKRNPPLWRISNADRFPNIMSRGKREKCMNCLSFGHSRAKCPKPKRPLVCYMCGESGHLEARCPNTRCLRCGSETGSFVPSCKKCMYWNNRICPICKLRGHSLNDCPDKWRRYHSTTKSNEFPNSRVVYNRRRYCCFCGMRGHLSDECRKAINRSEYPLIASEIKSFEKSYDDVLKSPYPPPGIKCRLLYNPNLVVNFTLAEKTTRFQLYGRFLKAVGLDRLIGVKNVKNRQQNITSPASVTITGTDLQKTPDKQASISAEDPQPSTSNKTTTRKEVAATSSSKMLPPPPPPLLSTPMDHDSDSNYSFSEHFEVSSSEEQLPKPTTKTQTKTSAPLPDFISLEDGVGDRFRETTDLLTIDDDLVGISSQFVEAHSDVDDVEIGMASEDVATVNKPCQAKIFISNEHYSYFQSKVGQEYLCKVLPEHELTGSLEKTSAGYALFLTGLPKSQELLQQALLKKYEELNNSRAQQQIDNQVPKNVKPLIRFLRDSIKQLYSNLGSATDLYKRLYDLEKSQTKVAMKSADRIRRTLNMIFLGQAGLYDGDAHFEILLKSLRTLLADFKDIEKTPQKMREEINTSWRLLFTAYDHKRYANLLATYIQMPAVKRNRIPALEIEANILGESMLDVTLSKEQKERFNDLTKSVQLKAELTAAQIEPEANLLMLNVVIPEQQQQQPTTNKKVVNQNKIKNIESKQLAEEEIEVNKETKTDTVQQQQAQEQNEQMTTLNTNDTTAADTNTANKTMTENTELEQQFCQNLLTAIETSLTTTTETGAKVVAGKMASRFWSCKSQEYLLDIIEIAKSSNSQSLDRLECIYKQAAEGKLSFNNHADIIKIYNRTVKK